MSPKTDDWSQSNFPRAMGRPARDALLVAGYTRLEDLNGAKESELKRLHGMGPKALDVLRATLADMGLSFADEKKE